MFFSALANGNASSPHNARAVTPYDIHVNGKTPYQPLFVLHASTLRCAVQSPALVIFLTEIWLVAAQPIAAVSGSNNPRDTKAIYHLRSLLVDHSSYGRWIVHRCPGLKNWHGETFT